MSEHIEPVRKMELLAPAGSLAVFETAVAAGADAVYVGAPGLHARAVGKDFTMAEVAAMIDHGHRNGVKVFLAVNSLLKEEEIPMAVEAMALLAALRPDGVIVQDLGLHLMIRRCFPELRLHASTLFGAHNSMAVRQFEEMGFSRVVLARELTLREIKRIRAQSSVELEVFIHGALCFSYSGLCLFSSALGGKSGLRGRCVQPCRRRYTAGVSAARKGGRAGRQPSSGYYFSMNDLAGLRLLPELHQAGIASLKIEGRLRSAQYVDGVVRGYRLVLDEFAERREVRKETMAAAEEFLRQAMGRKTTTGYFSTARPAAIISPQHSGNIGMYVGRVEKMIGKEQARIQLKTGLACGDRLRLHHEQSGERVAFTVKEMLVKSRAVQETAAGARVDVLLPRPFAIGDSLYKVDSKAGRSLERGRRAVAPQSFEKKIAALRARLPVREILRTLGYAETGSYKPQAKAAGAGSPVRTGGRGKGVAPPLKIWLKTDDPQLLKYRFPFPVEQLVLALDREVFERFTRMKNLRIDSRRIVWALPPIIQEDEMSSYTAVIGQLKRQGFVNFQLGHISQLQFFQDRLRVVLTADYTLNVLNSLALLALQEYGVQRGQASIETDKENLRRLAGHAGLLKRKMALGLTVYGTPALFTSRVAADHFRFGSTIVSPKDERFILRQAYGLTVVVAEQPFSLLPMLTELADLGLSYAVVDLCHQKLKGSDLELLAKRIAGAPAGRRLSTFNYQGTLL